MKHNLVTAGPLPTPEPRPGPCPPLPHTVTVQELASAADGLYCACYGVYRVTDHSTLVARLGLLSEDRGAPWWLHIASDGGRLYISTDRDGARENEALTEALTERIYRARQEVAA